MIISLPQLDVISLLSKASIFTGIEPPEQQLLAEKCQIKYCISEDVVIEQGDIGDTLYIIIRGIVQVSIRTPSLEWKPINTLREGDVFGEIAILRSIPRTARISTITPCEFLTINAKDFLDVYQYFPDKARDNIQLVVKKRLEALTI